VQMDALQHEALVLWRAGRSKGAFREQGHLNVCIRRDPYGRTC
jgi:hypothetical protein